MSETSYITETGAKLMPAMQARQDNLLARLHVHRLEFRRAIADRQFHRARDFVPTNPLDEWMEVGSLPGSALDVPYLAFIGRIEVIHLGGKTYAREARS